MPQPSNSARVWRAGRYTIDLSRPRVMGIVNITPDSFSDGGRSFNVRDAIVHAHALVRDGADILDLGAESSRPGAEPVPLEDELARLMPVLHEAVRLGIAVSVDTYKPDTMRAALDAGASIINDIRALQEPGAAEVVAQSDCGVCLMHMQGTPRTMRHTHVYSDVVAEVKAFLLERAAALRSLGVADARIAIDPGFGFGKSQEHNLALLRAAGEFVGTGHPTLIGVSRKSMIAHWSGRPEAPPQSRVAGSIAAALFAVECGAQVVRVHDVLQTVEALTLWNAMHSR